MAVIRWMVMAGLLASSVAYADEATPPTPPAPAPSHAKSPGVAAALSLTPTIVGLGLATFGLYTANRDPTCDGEYVPGTPRECKDHFPLGLNLTVAGGVLLAFGPSFGHIYNDRVWTTGLKVRLASIGVAAAGVAIAALSPHDCGEIVCTGEGIGMLVVIFGGGGTFLVGAGIDAVSADRAVRQRNSELSIARFHTPTGSAPALVFNTTF